MSSGLLDFFTLEASEYVEHLDALLARAHGGPPDLEACVRYARSLRGAAVMAKVGGIADVAGALERAGHALQAGSLAWSDALRGAWVAAIDDLKILIRGVRTWGDAETARAAARAHELAQFAPASAAAGSSAPNAMAFLATETADLARALAGFAENPVGPAAFAGTLQRVRGLRGIALLKDLPPFPEVVDALDAAAKAFELGGAVTPALCTLFATAANVLAEGSIALTRGDRPSTSSPALSAFAEAEATIAGRRAPDEEIIPIAALFFDDGASGIVSASPNPPTTAAQRFRMEIVSHAEHLRRLVADASVAADSATRERLARELGASTQSIARMSASFGEASLAEYFAEQRAQAALLAGAALQSLDKACRLLSAPNDMATADIVRALRGPATPAAPAPSVATPAPSTSEIVPIESLAPDDDIVDIASLAPDGEPSLVSRTAVAPPAAAAPASTAAPAAPIAPVAPTSPTPAAATPISSGTAPRGDALANLLQTGLAGLSTLDDAPLAAPANVEQDVTVPIEDLVYRGRDALDRAIELRDILRKNAGTPDPDLLAELFDLLELAATTD